jgi:ankyrin repeat protein
MVSRSRLRLRFYFTIHDDLSLSLSTIYVVASMTTSMALNSLANAIRIGDSSKVKILLSSGLIDVDASSSETPSLVLAATHGRTEIVDLLLNAGANVDAREPFTGTACHAAARKRDIDTLALLLARRPNLSLTDMERQTPLRVALNCSDERMIALLIEAGAPLDDSELACEAAATGVRAIEALRGRRVVLSALRDREGCTPMHSVAIAGNIAAMSLLASCGVDVDARDMFGDSCLHAAANWSKAESLRFLVQVGADIECANDEGFTPLILACAQGGAECVTLLLAAGASARAQSFDGSTACHAAAFASQCERDVVSALVAAGCDVDAPDAQGATARQLFALNGFLYDFEPDTIGSAQRQIAKVRLDLVRYRALQVCIGLQSRGIDALSMCEIMQHACGPVAPSIRFHQWWAIATAVKHFMK